MFWSNHPQTELFIVPFTTNSNLRLLHTLQFYVLRIFIHIVGGLGGMAGGDALAAAAGMALGQVSTLYP